MAEIKKSDKTSTSGKGQTTRGSELGKLSEVYKEYAGQLSDIQEKVAKQYAAVTSKYSETLLSLQHEAISAESATAKATQLLRAYNRQDRAAIVDAYRSLGEEMQQRYSTAYRNYQDATDECNKNLTDLWKKISDDYEKCNNDYADAVTDAVKNADFDKMDRMSKAVMAHSLLVNAMYLGEKPDA